MDVPSKTIEKMQLLPADKVKLVVLIEVLNRPLFFIDKYNSFVVM